jgi:hypothetical protein
MPTASELFEPIAMGAGQLDVSFAGHARPGTSPGEMAPGHGLSQSTFSR